MDKNEAKSPIFIWVKILLYQCMVTMFLLALAAFVMYKAGGGEKAAAITNIAIYVIVTMLGGWLIGKRMKVRRMFWGFLAGCFYFLLIILCSLILGGGNPSGGNSFWTTFMMCAGSGMIGGILS